MSGDREAVFHPGRGRNVNSFDQLPQEGDRLGLVPWLGRKSAA